MLGEAANHARRHAAAAHPEIEWAEIRAMRNVVVHEYAGVRLETIWETVQRDLPRLPPHTTHCPRRLRPFHPRRSSWEELQQRDVVPDAPACPPVTSQPETAPFAPPNKARDRAPARRACGTSPPCRTGSSIAPMVVHLAVLSTLCLG
ncbi:MAG: DUF86 domain-containing protein [Planctomycetota bacterium]|nr:DUF86 domain-containing protein [Planctomycetota bacterium]